MKEWFSDNILVYVIGLIAQILFSSRLIIQWIYSEKTKKVQNPLIFWILSIFAAMLLFIYGYKRKDFAIILGQTLTYFIYIRNIQLKGFIKKKTILIILIFFPLFILFSSLFEFNDKFNIFFKNKNIPLYLLIWGSLGQITFTFRFVYQWIYSEIKKRSLLPLGFWILSLTGSIMIISYAIIRKDPILLLGQIFGAFVYARNIFLEIRYGNKE